jgi:hypothetical protein
MRSIDFWWLTSDQQTTYTRVAFGHHRPIRDDEDPRSVDWKVQAGRVSQVDNWRGRFESTNVYRGLIVATAPLYAEQLLGPFLIDIDNSDENLEDVLLVTRKTAQILEHQLGVDPRNLRVFFTGHKGFNLEIHPQAVGLEGTIDSQVRKSADYLHGIVEALRVGRSWQTINQVSDAETVVDQIYGGRRSGYGLKHCYLRLHDSLNCWIASDGTAKSRMKTELTMDELSQLTIGEIVARSENPLD